MSGCNVHLDLSKWFSLTSLCLYQTHVSWMCSKSIFKGFDERTGVLIGLWSSSLLKRTSKGSHRASKQKGGEGKELHDPALRIDIM